MIVIYRRVSDFSVSIKIILAYLSDECQMKATVVIMFLYVSDFPCYTEIKDCSIRYNCKTLGGIIFFQFDRKNGSR